MDDMFMIDVTGDEMGESVLPSRIIARYRI
jgi:hypothetical protein